MTLTRHTSGTLASIIVNDELGTVSLLSSSPPSHNNNVQLTRYAHALLCELVGLGLGLRVGLGLTPTQTSKPQPLP